MVDGKEYEDEILMDNVNIRDEIKIYYELDDFLSYQNKMIYVSAFLYGFLFLPFSCLGFRWGKH
ncbi:MAG: hypothetical protein IJA10_12285 [Lachnospiraceae bacterium]|nr:hypothetical protein [Lachnospiraceae bacterium]